MTMSETMGAAERALHLVCDEPANGVALRPGGTVAGWAFSPVGVRRVSVWLDGHHLGEAGYGGERPDVVAASGVPEALRTGFACLVQAELPPRQRAELVVVAEDEAGRRAEVRRLVAVTDPPPADPGIASPELFPTVVCDEPAAGQEVSAAVDVAGWAYSPDRIFEVALWLDDRPLGRADLGLPRPDVVADHPEWQGADRGGFAFRLDPGDSAPFPRDAELRIVAKDGRGRAAETRRTIRLVEPPLPMAGSLDVPKERKPWDPLSKTGWSNPLVVHGWAVDPAGIDRIDILLDGVPVGQGQHGLPREDVELLQPAYRRRGLADTAGWVAVIPTDTLAGGLHELSAVVRGRSGTLDLGPTPVTLLAESVRADPARRRRIEALLRCPGCGGDPRRDGEELRCAACDRTIPANEFGTLLFDETYAGLDWRDAVATSHGCPKEMETIMAAVGDGLVLDVGAGLRENLANIVQTDAIAFPTTDVSANAEALPFADESFDAVVACALLEHVSNPLQVIREMRRVCKIGGRLFVDWVSVHPYHGFPHQYFNATETGLAWAMREAGGAEGAVQVASGWITVRLILEQWLASLEDDVTRASLSAMTVGDLVAMLRDAHDQPERVEALDHVFPNGRRLVPPKVIFTGVRAR